MLSDRRQAQSRGQPRPDAAWEHNDDQEQSNAVEHLLGSGHIEADRDQHVLHELRGSGEQKRADDRAERRADRRR